MYCILFAKLCYATEERGAHLMNLNCANASRLRAGRHGSFAGRWLASPRKANYHVTLRETSLLERS